MMEAADDKDPQARAEVEAPVEANARIREEAARQSKHADKGHVDDDYVQRAKAESPSRPSTRDIAIFGADDPSTQRRDLLDVGEEARAFARIAASRGTRLPLSIGVFGEWGSGKTFFMDSMAEHVAWLSSEARRAGDGSLFLPDIVQIKFNAWHYIETNLWASLVDYIFSELDRKLQGEKPREQVERLFEQLSTSRLLKLEAIDDLIVKRRERRVAEERLDRARRDYEAALLRQSQASAADFWQAVSASFRDKLKEDGSEARVERLAQALGFDDLSKSVAALNEVLKDAQTEAGRARALNRAMVAKLGQGWWIAGIVAALLVVPGAVIWVRDWLATLPETKWVAQVNSAALALSGVLAAASSVIGLAVRSARGALTRLEGFRDRLDAAVKERTEEFKRQSGEAAGFAQAERELARLRNELEQAERKFVDADKRSDDVLRDYHSASARGRLNAFIRDKLASGDYAKHLGLIATIRKDFEQLAQLMADAERDGASRRKYIEAHDEYRQRLQEKLDRAVNEGTLSEQEAEEWGRDSAVPEPGLFTRIILYIDDLDRCPPEKVVDVLQAIHLLLYFPLFVVVVAVDARWVSRSLREQYPQLLAENIIAPWRTRAFGPRAGKVEEEQGAGDENETAGHDAAAAKRRRPELATAATSHDYLEKIFQIPYWVRPMDGDASRKYVKGIAAPQAARGGAPGERVAPGREQAAYVARSMVLTPEELDFLETLAPFVGSTPRRGLRFVNVYRLVKTSLSETLQSELQEPSNHLSYRGLITQLAIVTGAPHIASTYFQLLENAAKGEEEIDSLGALCARLTRELAPVDGSQRTALLGALETLRAANEAHSFDTGPDLLRALDRFAPIARRYSFTARPH